MKNKDEIPIIFGDAIKPWDPEYIEMMKYESGDAETDAFKVPGRHDDPWLNVLEAFEPGSRPALEFAISHDAFGARVAGSVLDMGAGTCWATAKLSQLDRVKEVVAVDMSERFLTSTGVRIIRHYKGDESKIKFCVSSFNHVPFDNNTFDCVFLIAAIHHSLSPAKTLLEANRILKDEGVLIVIESPAPVIRLKGRRSHSIRVSRETGATELCYTKGDLEYLIRWAHFDRVACYPVPCRQTNRIKKAARAMARFMFLEEIIRPPTYVIIGEK